MNRRQQSSAARKGVIAAEAEAESGQQLGGVAEWSKAAVLKTAVPVTVPGVRIPSPPPIVSVISESKVRSACCVTCVHEVPQTALVDPNLGKNLGKSSRAWPAFGVDGGRF